MHGYEEPEAVGLTSLNKNWPVQVAIVAVADLAIARPEESKTAEFQLIVKLAPHAADYHQFEYGWTSLYQMARSTQNFILAANFLANCLSSRETKSLRQRAIQELVIYRRLHYEKGTKLHQHLSLNGNPHSQGTAHKLVVNAAKEERKKASLKFSAWKKDFVINEVPILSPATSASKEPKLNPAAIYAFKREAKAIIADQELQAMKVDEFCFLELSDPYSEGRSIDECPLDQPESEVPFNHMELDRVLKSVHLQALRLSHLTESKTPALIWCLEGLTKRPVEAMGVAAAHLVDSAAVARQIRKSCTSYYMQAALSYVEPESLEKALHASEQPIKL